MMPEVTIRRMERQDIDAVLKVEETVFSTPWSRASFETEVDENALARYFVAVAANQIVGYAGMWIILDEAHVTNIAVLPSFWGLGIGGKLVTSLMDCARSNKVVSMTLEVRTTNERAKNLYLRMGFVPQGVRVGYYSDTREDALIMWRENL
ncbi:MAG: ribosomal protein S18P-alanine acetyltransferase [Firmicutes bacterium]|nr:ribosomal protein S18P-alanine acetyltransferase [Bacillota bacterium]